MMPLKSSFLELCLKSIQQLGFKLLEQDYKKMQQQHLSRAVLIPANQSCCPLKSSGGKDEMMWQTGEDFFYLDAGQNVSHDDLFATVLWEILTEFWKKAHSQK